MTFVVSQSIDNTVLWWLFLSNSPKIDLISQIKCLNGHIFVELFQAQLRPNDVLFQSWTETGKEINVAIQIYLLNNEQNPKNRKKLTLSAKVFIDEAQERNIIFKRSKWVGRSRSCRFEIPNLSCSPKINLLIRAFISPNAQQNWEPFQVLWWLKFGL